MMMLHLQSIIKKIMSLNYPTWKNIKYFTTNHRTDNMNDFLETITQSPQYYHTPLCLVICIAINIFVQEHQFDIQLFKKLLKSHSLDGLFSNFFSDV